MKHIDIPTAWDELNRQQFAGVSEVLFDAFVHKHPVPYVRLKVLEALTGMTLMKDEQQRAGCKQKLAEYTRFLFNVSVNQDIAAVLSPELATALAWCLPEEIDNKQWLKELKNVEKLLKPSVDFNLAISVNLIPVIINNNETFHGPVFTIDKNGVLTTDLTAGAYFDASEYFSMYGKTSDISYLSNVAACLYRPGKSNYSTFEAQQRAEIFKKSSPKYLKAVWLMMLAWKNFFSKHSVFGILFSDAEPNENKINIGSSSLIYTMSKSGYGSLNEVANMHIDDFFAIQVSHIREAVNALRLAKKNNAEIAKDLNLPIDIIIKL